MATEHIRSPNFGQPEVKLLIHLKDYQLCFIGSRGMGALEYERPLFPSEKRAVTFEIKSLVDVVQEILSQREGFGTNLKEVDRKAISDIIKIGTSAGGARAKAVIAYNAKTGEVKSGQAKAPKGFEHWLILVWIQLRATFSNHANTEANLS